MQINSVQPVNATTNSSTPTPALLLNKLDDIFKNILNDQSKIIPKHPIYKSTWEQSDIRKVDSIRNEYQQLQLSKLPSVSQQLDSIEIIAFKLSKIMKTQLSNLAIAYSNKGLSSTGVTYALPSKALTIIDAPVVNGFIQYDAEFSIHKNDINMEIVVDGTDVNQIVSPFFTAITSLDDICLEFFSYRIANQEIQNACTALLKVNCNPEDKQIKFLNTIGDYCHNMFGKNNLKEVSALYDSCLNENGIALLDRLNRRLIEIDCSNQEKIKQVIQLLDMDHINQVQRSIQHHIQLKKIIPNTLKYIDLLIQSPNFESWCLDQILALEKMHSNCGEFDEAFELVYKYLLPHSKTSVGATELLCFIINYRCQMTNTLPRDMVSKISNHMINITRSLNLTETDKNVLRTFVQKSAINANESVLLLLAEAKNNLKNHDFVKELAQVYVKELCTFHPMGAKAARLLFNV